MTKKVYLYKDFSASYFSGDFEVQLQVNVSAIDLAQFFGAFALSNLKDDLYAALTGNNNTLAVMIDGTYAATSQWNFGLYSRAGTSSTTAVGSIALSLNTDYYITI